MRHRQDLRARATKANVGQAMVEFALVAPIFLTVLFGIFEIGRLMIEYTSIANAAREGARLGVIATIQPTYIAGEARRFTIAVGATPVVTMIVRRNGTPIPITTPRTTGDSVDVSVSHTFLPMGFLNDPSIPLSSSARMIVE
jgi:Flp pilus assembly protein TadG